MFSFRNAWRFLHCYHLQLRCSEFYTCWYQKKKQGTVKTAEKGAFCLAEGFATVFKWSVYDARLIHHTKHMFSLSHCLSYERMTRTDPVSALPPHSSREITHRCLCPFSHNKARTILFETVWNWSLFQWFLAVNCAALLNNFGVCPVQDIKLYRTLSQLPTRLTTNLKTFHLNWGKLNQTKLN